GHAHTVEGRLPDAVAILERGKTLCEDADPDHPQPLARNLRSVAPNILASLGYAYSLGGRPHDGARLLQQALNALEEYGQRVWYVVMLTQLAEAWLLGGELVRARECASRALSMARERGERGFEAGALRMLGAVAIPEAARDLEAARAHYRGALVLAEERAMRPLVAHCHAGLATIHTLLGDPTGAGAHRTTALEICRTLGMSAPWELAQSEVSSA